MSACRHEESNLKEAVNPLTGGSAKLKSVDKPFNFFVEIIHQYHVNDVMTISDLRISVNSLIHRGK